MTAEHKNILMAQYNDLDPVWLLKELKRLQEHFHKLAWKPQENLTNILENKMIANYSDSNHKHLSVDSDANSIIADDKKSNLAEEATIITQDELPEDKKLVLQRYKSTNKPRKQLVPRTWRTRKDPVAEIWDNVQLMLTINPERTAKSILHDLCSNQPALNTNILRTLQRRINVWRTTQLKLFQANELLRIPYQNNAIQQFIRLTNRASIG